MIRVVRPATPPTVLAVEGRRRQEEHCAAHAAGEREFQFDAAIYGHEAVKQALVDMQHRKCCYCESYVRHVTPGTIDHYRPKAASQQSAGEALTRPGYYWLAYEWENLLFACPTCNQTKRNLFPLDDTTRRARSHTDPLAREEPLLIDPSKNDPAEFISFREEFAFPLEDNLRGRTSIAILKINDRKDLVERRREKLQILRALKRIVTAIPQSPEAADAQQILNDFKADTGEYAAMSRTSLP
jgi:uncharacterized protein (TIGR02646 family)